MPDKKKVLVVEDDPHIGKVFLLKLAQEGYEAKIATDGEAGWQAIQDQKPNLVMLDLMLPKKDGFWVMEQIRTKPELAAIPVIVLTNLGQDQDRERAMGLGAKAYVIKSDTPIKDIIDGVKQHLV